MCVASLGRSPQVVVIAIADEQYRKVGSPGFVSTVSVSAAMKYTTECRVRQDLQRREDWSEV